MTNLLAVISVGFLLGVRHATDPDHVIAVSTIVSRQRDIRHAGMVGALWGVGHTITIFLVGLAIILFNLAIPPRVGLAMELAVGLMLILLGVLNLAGVTQWITHRFTPVTTTSEPESRTPTSTNMKVFSANTFTVWPGDSYASGRKTQRFISNCVATVRAISASQAPRGWTRARTRRIGGCRSTCLKRHSRSSLGDRISSGFRAGDDRRNDADHDDYRCSVCLRGQEICTPKSWPWICIWLGKHCFRSIYYLPDWLYSRTLHHSSALDAALSKFLKRTTGRSPITNGSS